MKHLFLLTLLLIPCTLFAEVKLSDRPSSGKDAFNLVERKSQAAICFDDNDYLVVKKAASLFAADVEMVTGHKPSRQTYGIIRRF